MSDTSSRLVVPFLPRAFDKLWATVLVVVGIGSLAMGARTAVVPPLYTLRCDRAAGSCEHTAPDMFGGGRPIRMPLAQLHDSRVVPAKHGEQAWLVTNGQYDVHLGNPTSDGAHVANYRRLAPDFQAFLADPSRATFAATYPGMGGPGLWIFVGMGLVLSFFGLKWIRGWRAELVFDRDAGTLTITRRPTFFLSPATRTVPLADIHRLELLGGRMFLGYGVVETATLVIIGAHGLIFSRRLVLDNTSRGPIQERFQAMRAFIGQKAA